MKRLSRILDGNGYRYIGGALAVLGHVMLGALAWNGSLFAIASLVITAIFWTGLAVINGISWSRTTSSWQRSLLGWEETQNLAVDYVHLLMEACDALSTWDRERADDIIARTRTISALRQKNLNERMD